MPANSDPKNMVAKMAMFCPVAGDLAAGNSVEAGGLQQVKNRHFHGQTSGIDGRGAKMKCRLGG